VAIPGSAGVLACMLAETALRENPAGEDACAPRLNSMPLGQRVNRREKRFP